MTPTRPIEALLNADCRILITHLRHMDTDLQIICTPHQSEMYYLVANQSVRAKDLQIEGKCSRP